ncbi:MAG: hypothetical protein AAB590_03055 [Patescibacteria group bacterium]
MSPETEKIYNVAFDIIEIRLDKKEEVVPFTVTLEKGKTKPTVSMYEPVSKNTVEQLEIIRKDLRKMIENQEIVALCLCYDMTITDPRTNEKTDAILMELAGKGSDTIHIYIPYSFQAEEIVKKPFQTHSDQKYY